MTPAQVAEWYVEAQGRLEALKGPFNFWGQTTPIPVRFCDGHGLHQADLQELRQALEEAKDWILAGIFGEDGPPCGVTGQQAFIEVYGIIANAQRVGREDLP